jgi:hypothetical protein
MRFSIGFKLYDKSGAQVGTATSNIAGLDPHGTWRFKALVYEDSAVSARLSALFGH